MKILVLGGAGYIGSHTGYELKHDLVYTDDKTYTVNRLLELFGKMSFNGLM